MNFVVTPDGSVRSYRQKSIAAAMANQLKDAGAVLATEDDLSKISTPVLVTLHNVIRPEKPVTRFADRATAEKRMKGVLETLAKPGEAPDLGIAPEDETTEDSRQIDIEDETPLTPEEFTPDPTKTQEENDAMAAAAKNARKTARKSPAKKSAAKKAPRAEANPITDATVRKVIKMRAAGSGWPEILTEIGEKPNFVLRVRPLMKKLDKSSVMALGPGSPNYGKGKPKKAAKKAAK